MPAGLDAWPLGGKELYHLIAHAMQRENGYLLCRAADPDSLVFVLVTAVGQGQIGRGGYTEEAGVSDRWTFPTLADAVVAFGHWWLDEWRSEPGGWIRHQPSNRRRKYNMAGEVLTEEVRE